MKEVISQIKKELSNVRKERNELKVKVNLSEISKSRRDESLKDKIQSVKVKAKLAESKKIDSVKKKLTCSNEKNCKLGNQLGKLNKFKRKIEKVECFVFIQKQSYLFGQAVQRKLTSL